jgi:glucose/arabinose dehydrogenase
VYFIVELSFQSGSTVIVTESIVEDRDTRNGFTWEISLSGVADGFVPLLLFNSTELAVHDGSEISQPGPIGEITIHSVTHGKPEPKWERVPRLESLEMKGHCLALQLPPEDAEDAVSSAEYRALLKCRGPDSAAPAAQVVPTLPKSQPQLPKKLGVAPGFDVLHLPLDTSVMPSAIAVEPNGTPVVCSLKGRIFFAKDSDGDGLPDTWVEHGDHLAAPFGVLADELGIFVTHKAELLWFQEGDEQGKYSPCPEVLATGWGLTEDYHDWTFGLVKGTKGFYIGTGSDYTHRGRPAEARKWRGRILRVSPDGEIEEVARGARYPTGLAINRDDQVFFTDNQGVQNTFNEINHVIPGSRYGVPALDDPPPDQDPWPERAPAIKIPHPWTRSINGICFLYANGKWGPFEGHGIGCEYDTRGLIRFSLQRIGDTYQGACYPFTLPEDQVPEDDRLLGPICCAVGSNGDLYVGGLRDSGWGGGNNVGELVRVQPSDHVPLGIREVRASREGFIIDFTAPIDAELAAQPAIYTISSYHRIWQGTYATPDSDRRTEKIRSIQVSQDRQSVVLTLESMRPGFVYELHLGAIGERASTLWPAEAYYTLNTVPE